MTKVAFKLEGMACEHCVQAVTDAITEADGTADVLVDMESGAVSFSYDPGKTPIEVIRKAIEEEGFDIVG